MGPGCGQCRPGVKGGLFIDSICLVFTSEMQPSCKWEFLSVYFKQVPMSQIIKEMRRKGRKERKKGEKEVGGGLRRRKGWRRAIPSGASPFARSY